MRLTWVEACIVAFIFGFAVLFFYFVHKMFEQTTVVGTIKWAVVVLVLALGSSSSSRKSS